jgi:3-isopropylmalate dehydratase small subunit
VDAFRKQVLLNGWDDIALTLRAGEKIDSFEKTQATQAPWL